MDTEVISVKEHQQQLRALLEAMRIGLERARVGSFPVIYLTPEMASSSDYYQRAKEAVDEIWEKMRNAEEVNLAEYSELNIELLKVTI